MDTNSLGVMNSLNKNGLNHGFTLIELLVTVAITAVVLGSSIAGYNNFNENQKLKQAALTFKNNLRLAQSKAITAQRPVNFPDCEELYSYQIQYINSTSYKMLSICVVNGTNTPSPDEMIFFLPTNVTFNSNFTNINFYRLSKGTTADQNIQLTSGARTVTVTLLNGDISISY
jgi:type IV fimbrial biogenesis protein FimT